MSEEYSVRNLHSTYIAKPPLISNLSTPLNLVVVAHPDDEVLGFGATGAKLVAAGERVQSVILSGSVDARTLRPNDDELYADILAANQMLGFAEPVLGTFPNIKLNTVPHLDIVQFIEEQIVRFKPTRIFTHHHGDLNEDHLHVTRACLAATRLPQRRSGLPRIRSVLAMEIPSSTDWSFPGVHPAFAANVFVEIDAFLEKKLAALGQYRRVMRPFPHPRSVEALTGLAAMRGAQAGLRHAEAFVLLQQLEL